MRRAVATTSLLVGMALADAFTPGAVMLMIFPGAKGVSMGGAFSAIADDATAIYYNVGGLGFFRNMEVHFTHAPWLRTIVPDAYYEYFSAVFPTRMGNFGASLTYLTPGEVEVYDEQGTYRGSFKPYDVSLSIGYGVVPLPGLGIGLSSKIFYSYLVPEWVMREILNEPGGGTAVTFAVDGGVLYKTPIPGLNLAVALTNIGPGVSYTGSGESDPLPTTLRIGMAYGLLRTKYHRFTIAADYHKVLPGLTDDYDKGGMNYILNEGWRSIGADYTFYDMISLRMGYFHDRYGYRMGPTFGGGITYGSFKLDIADDGSIYDFNKHNPDAKRNLRFTFSFVKPVSFETGPKPGASVAAGKIYEFYDVEKAPELIEFVQPDYPAEALSLGLEGRVTVQVVIDEEGNVVPGSEKVVQSTNELFNAPALEAAGKCKFTPGEIGGKRVKVRVNIPFTFKPPKE
ncbi:MAG: PorV/PorQ family protein [candidate division WOR-3 bacterium]